MGEAKKRAEMGLGPKQLKMQVPLAQLKDRECKCGSKAFLQVYGLKELPALYSPSNRAETMMVHVGFACLVCGKTKPLSPDDEDKMEDQRSEDGKEEKLEEKSDIEVVKR